MWQARSHAEDDAKKAKLSGRFRHLPEVKLDLGAKRREKPVLAPS